MSRLTAMCTAVGLVFLIASPAQAQGNKEEDCAYQAAVVAAVQKARLDGVSQKNVVQTIRADGTDWPENYDNAIPIFAAQIYALKKRDLRKTDLGAEWQNTCMSN